MYLFKEPILLIGLFYFTEFDWMIGRIFDLECFSKVCLQRVSSRLGIFGSSASVVWCSDPDPFFNFVLRNPMIVVVLVPFILSVRVTDPDPTVLVGSGFVLKKDLIRILSEHLD